MTFNILIGVQGLSYLWYHVIVIFDLKGEYRRVSRLEYPCDLAKSYFIQYLNTSTPLQSVLKVVDVKCNSTYGTCTKITIYMAAFHLQWSMAFQNILILQFLVHVAFYVMDQPPASWCILLVNTVQWETTLARILVDFNFYAPVTLSAVKIIFVSPIDRCLPSLCVFCKWRHILTVCFRF